MQKIRPDLDIGGNIQQMRYQNKLTQDQVIARLNLMGIPISLIVKVVVSKNIYFLFVQVIRYCSVPDVSINKLSTFIGNHVRHRILPDHHHFE